MSQWVRLWEDMPSDPKWRVIARKSGQCIGNVIAVFNFMMVCANTNATERSPNAPERGELVGWDDEDIGAALDIKGEDVAAIRKAMNGKVLDGLKLRAWEKRQPLREDGSSERAKAWRERKRTEANAEKLADSDSDSETNSLRSLVRARETTTNKTKSKLEEKAEPTASQISDATEKGLAEARMKAEWKAFRDYNLARGSELADWDAAWRMWLDKMKNSPPGKPNGQAALKQVFVEEDSEQWKAWENYYRKSYGKPPPKTNRGHTMVRGWYFPSELPPSEKLPNPF